ncbi:uncharacterized protein [Parasteatoda tepidariorum]|uniref:uncharacterized protein n=1 Tax=Parasteatoda tepidariorum TaxID=114398 RepID=UPI00077F9C8F|nr:uncharacterized protein LOC107455142 [Parasteatoda tepidariorum]
MFQNQIPKSLLSDRNAVFTSSHFKKFLKHNKIQQLLTTTHYPQSNGKVERLGQTIIACLKCKINEKPTKTPWPTLLKDIVNIHNLTPHSATKFPPAYLMHGRLPYENPLNEEIYPPVEEAKKIAIQRTKENHERNEIYYDAKFLDIDFKTDELVMFEEFTYPNTRNLSPPFIGPYKIPQ